MSDKLYGLIGNPVVHSYSPIIYKYLFEKYRIDGEYKLFNIEKNDLVEQMRRFKKERIQGFNITAPFKEEILKYVDIRDSIVDDVGSTNTIKNDFGKFLAYNTDCYGLEKSFENNNIQLESKSVLIFGAGGVVSSICKVLSDNNVEKIIILNRTVEKIKKILKRIKKRRITLSHGELFTSNINELAQDVDIVINATSVDLVSRGIVDINFNLINRNIIFFDLIYNPIMTQMLKLAQKNGHRYFNGMDMLIFQALKSFEIWTSIKTDLQDYKNIKNILTLQNVKNK